MVNDCCLHVSGRAPLGKNGGRVAWHRAFAHPHRPMAFPNLAYGTPRKLPKAKSLTGRVVVLDIAFASTAGGASFEKVTLPFIEGLGERLAMWVDHHDHDRHAEYRDHPRFVLRSKAEAPACPELVTPEIVEAAGSVDTICC